MSCVSCQCENNLTLLNYENINSFCCRACLPNLYAEAEAVGMKLYRPAFDTGEVVTCLTVFHEDDPALALDSHSLFFQPWEPLEPWKQPQNFTDQ